LRRPSPSVRDSARAARATGNAHVSNSLPSVASSSFSVLSGSSDGSVFLSPSVQEEARRREIWLGKRPVDCDADVSAPRGYYIMFLLLFLFSRLLFYFFRMCYFLSSHLFCL
jgi:hypothetical protein